MKFVLAMVAGVSLWGLMGATTLQPQPETAPAETAPAHPPAAPHPAAPAYPGTWGHWGYSAVPGYPGTPGTMWPDPPTAAAAPAGVPAPAVFPPPVAGGFPVPQPAGSYRHTEPALRYPWFVSGRYRGYPGPGPMYDYRVRVWWDPGYYRVHAPRK